MGTTKERSGFSVLGNPVCGERKPDNACCRGAGPGINGRQFPLGLLCGGVERWHGDYSVVIMSTNQVHQFDCLANDYWRLTKS